MTRHSILVVTHERRLMRTVTRALVSAGCDVTSCELQREEVARRVASEKVGMFIVDADLEFEDVVWTVETISRANPDTPVLMVSRDLGKSSRLQEILNRGLNNLIARHGGVASGHHHLDETELIATVHKLLNKDIFGIDKYLPAQGIEVHERTLTHSSDRADALKELQEFVSAIDCYAGIQPMVIAVADELLMNAIFSAPRDAEGRPKYEHLDRSSSFAFEPNETVRFQYTCDGRSVLTCVTDNFGSLERDSIMRYMSLGSQEKGQPEQKAGGAGLGLYLVVRSITQLVFNIEKNRRTEVIASAYIRGGRRAFLHSGQSLNIFFSQPDDE